MNPSVARSLMLVLALLTATAGATDRAMESPLPTVGDSWTYRTNSTLGAGLSLGGTAVLTVIAVGPERIGGVTFDAVRMSVRGIGTAAGTLTSEFISARASGAWQLSGEEVVELAGFKVVSSVLNLEANGTLQTQPVPIPFQISALNTSTYRFVSDGWRLPLGVGDSSVVRSELNFTEDLQVSYGIPGPRNHASGVVGWNITYHLEASVLVDTPAGRFEAYRIRQASVDGSSVVLFYAPAAGNYVRTESHNGTSEVGRAELTSYRYQAREPPRFLGLTGDQWLVGGAVTAAAAGSLFLWWRRRRRRPRLEPSPAV